MLRILFILNSNCVSHECGSLEVNLGIEPGRPAALTLKKCLEGARRIDRCWGKRRAKERRQRLEGLQHALTTAQLRLERSPDDPFIQAEVDAARENLTQFNSAKARWVDSVIQARWMEDGDRGSKLFYKSFRSMAAAKEIPELIDSQGNLSSTWEEMAGTTTNFFEGIFGEAPCGFLPGGDPVAMQ